jgi:hypothetical protein
MTPLYGHVSEETAFTRDNYPWGFKLKCNIKWWLEKNDKNGFRFVTRTQDPRNGKWCAPKKSTYAGLAACMFLDEKDHCHWSGLGLADGYNSSKILEFMDKYPKADYSLVKPVAQIMVVRQERALIVANAEPLSQEAEKNKTEIEQSIFKFREILRRLV